MSEEPQETINPPQIENAEIVDQETSQKTMTPGQAESRQESQTLTGEGTPEKDVPSVQPAIEVTRGHEDHHTDTVVLPFINQTVTVPGGIYTVVFIGLGALTLLEIVLGSIIPSGSVKVIALLAIAVLKALLVVMFYMHLRTDNPIFRLVLGLPLLVVILSMMYLIAVPPQGGLGYLPPRGPAPEAAAVLTQESSAVATQQAATDVTQEAAVVLTQNAAAVVTQEASAVVTQEAPAVVTQES